MPRPERSRYRLAAFGLIVVLLALGVIPGYLTLDPAWRPFVVRLACALIVIVGCTRMIRRVRNAIADEPLSPLDAPAPAPRAPMLDDRFVRLRDDLLFSRRSRRYFENFLWPRLRGLGGADLPEPAPGRRAGPSLRTLERLIADIERRP